MRHLGYTFVVVLLFENKHLSPLPSDIGKHTSLHLYYSRAHLYFRQKSISSPRFAIPISAIRQLFGQSAARTTCRSRRCAIDIIIPPRRSSSARATQQLSHRDVLSRASARTRTYCTSRVPPSRRDTNHTINERIGPKTCTRSCRRARTSV